jgi:hypothetical protein
MVELFVILEKQNYFLLSIFIFLSRKYYFEIKNIIKNAHVFHVFVEKENLCILI